jgi:hypothetical protein
MKGSDKLQFVETNRWRPPDDTLKFVGHRLRF